MAITLTQLKWVDADVTAICTDQIGTYVYFGTNEGEVWRYTVAGGGLTLMKALDSGIVSISLYSTTLLYISTKGGYVYSLTTS